MTCRWLFAIFSVLPLTTPMPLQSAQSPAEPPTEGVDEMFARARQLAFSGKRTEAIALCRTALERSPNYHDIRILVGRIHAWEGRYEEGRRELQRVLKADPSHQDGRMALVDLELWADQPRRAEQLCNEGLALDPMQPALLYKKARALKALGDYPRALISAKQAHGADVNFHDARLLVENLTELNQRSKLSLSAGYDRFDRTFDDPWRTFSVSGSHRFDAGSVIGRINRASRFGDTGHQFEVDAYPRLGEGTYLYLNAGISSSSIFPHHRYGGEIYRNFPKGVEGSLGFRHLRFSASTVTIYTGSIGKYWGDYLFGLRINATPSSIGTSKSGSASVRRYLGDAENYLSFSLGTGVSPDQSNPDEAILKLRSRKAGLSAQGWIYRRFILSGGIGYEIQEIDQNTERTQTSFNLGLEWRF